MLLLGVALIPGPHTVVAWAAAGAGGLNFADACYRLRKSIQTLDVDGGELAPTSP